MALYAILLNLLCTLLFPHDMTDYQGFADYFYSRKAWIFGFLGALFVIDVGDTLIKGLPYFEALGPVYYFRTVSLLVLSIVAMFVRNRRFPAALVVFALVCESCVYSDGAPDNGMRSRGSIRPHGSPIRPNETIGSRSRLQACA